MIPCLLCIEHVDGSKPGVYALALTTFATEADRQLANRQREQAHDPGVWFTIPALASDDKPLPHISFTPTWLFR